MKAILSLTCLCACCLPAVWADEAKPRIQHGAARVMPVPPRDKGKTEAIPEIYAKDKAVALKLEDLQRGERGLHLNMKLRLINPTDKAIHFTGYSAQSPITQTQQWVDGKWIGEPRVLRCGTGLQRITIEPGQSAVFSVNVEGAQLPARVGLSYTPEKQAMIEVWSEKIEG